jgi:hypothetical protein
MGRIIMKDPVTGKLVVGDSGSGAGEVRPGAGRNPTGNTSVIPANPRIKDEDRTAAAKASAKRFDPRSVKGARARQQLLMKYGYAIGGADGVWGPRSKAAWKNLLAAHENGLNFRNAGTYWSNHHPRGHQNDSDNAQGEGKGSAPVDTAGTTPTPTPTTEPEPEDTGSNTDAFMKLLQGLLKGSNQGNPNKLALAATNAEFGPAMSESKRTFNQILAQGKQNVADTRNWFTGLLGTHDTNAAAASAGYDEMVNDTSSVLNNVLAGVQDETARVQAAKVGAANQTEMQQAAGSADTFATSMRDALGALAGDVLRRVQRGNRDDQMAARDQYLDLVKQRQSSLVTNREAFRQSGQAQQSEAIKQYATLALLPQEMQGAELDNILKLLDQDYTKARIAATNRSNQPDAGDVPDTAKTWMQMDRKERNAAIDAVLKYAYGPGGNPVGSRQQMLAKLQQGFKAEGLQSKQAWQAILARVRNAHPVWWRTGTHVQAD